MNDGLNDSQRRMAETLDGMLVVDAGPGTGKTKTIVNRYINLVTGKGLDDKVDPKDILLLTFTRNAAQEMEDRIKSGLTGQDPAKKEAQSEDPDYQLKLKLSTHVRVQTFDSLCLSVIKDFPDEAGRLFGIEPRLTRSVSMESNDTMNRRDFSGFIDRFIEEHGTEYGTWSAIAQDEVQSLYSLIGRMLSRGVYPLKNGGWFGDTSYIQGDPDLLLQRMIGYNQLEGNQKISVLQKKMNESCKDINKVAPLPEDFDPDAGVLPEHMLSDAAFEDRTEMIRMIHDIYLGYVEERISRDRLTFGIAAMLAFSILYSDKEARRAYSFRYLMIDEFQDTNAAQLMMSLMILKEPNLCVVGDWRQGIYGFRYVSIEYILRFEDKVAEIGRMLNEDGIERMTFEIPATVRLRFDTNYRSSQTVIDHAFRCLTLKATKSERLIPYPGSDSDGLGSSSDALLDGRTEVRFLQAGSQDLEAEMVERCIREYVGSGRYEAAEVRAGEDGSSSLTTRPLRLGDIAVLCRSTKACRKVAEHLNRNGVHAFLQGDVDIMSTRWGKLALAWLRYVSNDADPRGIGAIMADMGYCLEDCKRAALKPSEAPQGIRDQRELLRSKRRRINELLTSIFGWYHASDDISQAIVNILSGLHSGSLITISDLITLMEEDISKTNGGRAVYPVETDFGSDAVTVMTMHKAKGLEFPAVIIPYVDQNAMPSTKGEQSSFLFDKETGIRCTRTVGRFPGYSKICRSWRTDLCKETTSDIRKQERYDEERRLMFVSMSRAKQYETVISGPKPSEFMRELCDEPETSIEWYELPDTETDIIGSPRPEIDGYVPRRKALAVHDLMVLNFGGGRREEDADETVAEGRGKEYGTRVHKEAEDMHNTGTARFTYPECGWIARNVLSRIRDPWGRNGGYAAGLLASYAEVGCTLPLDGPDVVVRGVIDLLIVFEDRIEIHDYKTDGSRDNDDQYKLQLSVYAHAAESFYKGLPVRCFIDYAYLQEQVEFEPLPLDVIRVKAEEALIRLAQPPADDAPDISGELEIE